MASDSDEGNVMRFSHPAFLALLPLAFWYWRRSFSADTRSVRALLRLAIAFLVVLAMSGWEIRGGDSSMTAAVVVDRSISMATYDTAMRTRLRSLAKGMRTTDRIGLVAFGAHPALEQPLAVGLDRGLSSPDIASGGTNIELALRAARALLPADTERRIVLMSDGQQTSGDALKEAARAAADGIRIDVVAPAAATRANDPLAVAAISAPSIVRAGEPFEIAVTVDGPPRTSGTVIVTPEGASPIETNVTLGATGSATVRFDQTHTSSGLYAYRASARGPADDFASADDDTSSGIAVTVTSEPRLLRVGSPSSIVGDVLSRGGFALTRVSPSQFPVSPGALSNVDAVVLDDVAGDELDERQSTALQRYVEQAGGGLLVLGGARSLEPGMAKNGPLSTLLPVDLRPRAGNRAPAVSLVIVFDKSGSMDDRVDGVPRIEYARQAVRQVLESISPADRLGVIAFDSEPHEVIPVRAGHQGPSVDERLRQVRAGGPTLIAPALASAIAWLRSSDSRASAKRQILLLSDGRTDPADAARAQSLARDGGVSVSVVALGEASERNFLAALTAATGGRAYFPANVRELPALVAREAARVAGGRTVEEAFTPVAAPHPITAGQNLALPALSGYVVSTARPGARPVILSHLGDPIFVTARAGLGKVAVYTADLQSDWSSRLLTWKGFSPLFLRSTRWVSRRAVDDEIVTTIDTDGESARVAVEAYRPDGAARDLLDVSGTVRQPSGELLPVSFVPVAAGHFEADVATSSTGLYMLSIRATDRDSGAEHAIVRAMYWSAERERLHRGVNRELLVQLATTTGGRMLPENDSPFAGPRPPSYWDATPLAIVTALVLYLLHVLAPGLDTIMNRFGRQFGQRLGRRRRLRVSTESRDAA